MSYGLPETGDLDWADPLNNSVEALHADVQSAKADSETAKSASTVAISIAQASREAVLSGNPDPAFASLIEEEGSATRDALSVTIEDVAPAKVATDIDDEESSVGAALVAKYPRRSEIPTNVSYLDLPTTNLWTAHSFSKRSGLPIAPEQSMSAGRLAYALGAPMLDLDYQSTRDGVLIGLHDTDTSTVSATNVTVANTGYAYMPQIYHPLDVGTGWAAEDFATLSALLREFGGRVVMTIEPKGGLVDVAPLAALIQSLGLVDSVYINSGTSAVIAAVVAAGCLPHAFGGTTTAHLDAQAAAMGASVGKGIVEVPIDANTALVDYAVGKGFWRIIAGPINTAGTPTSITKFSQLVAIDSSAGMASGRVNGFVNDAVGYLGRTGGDTTASADSLADAVRTGRRPPGTRVVNSPGGTWWSTSGAELKNASGGRSVILGSLSCTPATTGTRSCKGVMATLTSTTSERFTWCLMMTDEAPANVAADTGRTGYVIGLSANGTLNLWTMVGNTRTLVGASPVTALLVAGAEFKIDFEWTSTQIRAVRRDVAAATLSGAQPAATVTSLAVNALPANIASGVKIALPNGTEATVNGAHTAGATTLTVTSVAVPAMASGASLYISTGWTNNTDWRGKHFGAYTTMTSGQAFLTDLAKTA